MESRGLAAARRRSRAAVALDRRCVRHFKAREPERIEALWQSIQAYRSLLAQYHQRDEAVRRRRERLPARARLVYFWDAVAGFPLFGYGALVNALPYYVPRWVAHRMARKETDYATIRSAGQRGGLPPLLGAGDLAGLPRGGAVVGAGLCALAARSRARSRIVI